MFANSKAYISKLKAEVANFRYAFGTTAVDRDRWAARTQELEAKADISKLKAEVANFRYAFETTAVDRDRWAARAQELEAKLDATLRQTVARALGPQQANTSDPVPTQLPPIDLSSNTNLHAGCSSPKPRATIFS